MAAKVAAEHNARSAGKPNSRLARLRRRFEAFARKERRRAEMAGEFRLLGLSFELWLFERACGWSERTLGPAGTAAGWAWFARLHHQTQAELAWDGLRATADGPVRQQLDERFVAARRKF